MLARGRDVSRDGPRALARDFYVSGKGTLATYMLFVVVAFHFRVVFGEQPFLARTHGAAWDEYRARVPRWLI